jgi:hypothetical protein
MALTAVVTHQVQSVAQPGVFTKAFTANLGMSGSEGATLLSSGKFFQSMTGTLSMTGTASPQPVGISPRNRLLVPFVSSSIWNTPIGASATRIPVNLPPVATTLVDEQDIVLMDPTQPMTIFLQNGGFASNRCTGTGNLGQACIPASFVVPSQTKNFSTGAVTNDQTTYIQGGSFGRCTAGNSPTLDHATSPNKSLGGDGLAGGRGGTSMDCLGGTLRLGELVPGGVIPHALALSLDDIDNSTNHFIWPATKQDSYGYNGSNPNMGPGALLALPVNFNVAGLLTAPAKILAQCLINYGGYNTNDTKNSSFHICTEFGPTGAVADQFLSVWGFPLATSGGNANWTADIQTIYASLQAITSNTLAQYTTNVNNYNTGNPANYTGAGGGVPLVPFSPNLAPVTVAQGAPNIVFINFENKPFDLPSATFPLTSAILQATPGYAWHTQFFDVSQPSGPNYQAVTFGTLSGDSQFFADDGFHNINLPSFYRQLTAKGVQFGAYAEAVTTANLRTGISGTSPYVQRHFAISYDSNYNVAPPFYGPDANGSLIANAGSSGTAFGINGSPTNFTGTNTFSAMIANMNGANPASFYYAGGCLTNCAHGNTCAAPWSPSGTITADCDAYLAHMIGLIKATSWYANHGNIVIWCDEGSHSGGSGEQTDLAIINEAGAKGQHAFGPGRLDHTGLLYDLLKAYGVAGVGHATAAQPGSIESLLDLG